MKLMIKYGDGILVLAVCGGLLFSETEGIIPQVVHIDPHIHYEHISPPAGIDFTVGTYSVSTDSETAMIY